MVPIVMFSVATWQWLLLISICNPTYSQEIFTSRFSFSTPGTQFVPLNMSVQLISTLLTNSLKICAVSCTNNVLCRVFDYGVLAPKQCRLFEGDAETLGDIVSLPSSQSRVGTIQLSADLFSEYGSPCFTSCYHSRYLQCSGNFTCECMPHTYWDPSVSMCLPQSFILGASCKQNMSMCREDLDYTCFQFNECGPADLLIGSTVAGYGNGTAGNDNQGLNGSRGIYISPENEDLYVSDALNYRAQRFSFGNRTGKMVAGSGYPNCTLTEIRQVVDITVDSAQNVYIADYGCNRAMRWPPSATPGTIVTVGYQVASVAFDQYGNLYTSLLGSHIVLKNNMTIVAGHCNTSGNGSTYLNSPRGLFFDTNTSSLFVCDSVNHRIQKFQMNSTTGITVAGGNGQGSAANQLHTPASVWVSHKTGFMYIADTFNNRVQRWKMNDTSGVPIAGNGMTGTLSTMLNIPVGVALNANETFLYVSESGNHRVQRFKLIV